MWAPEQRSSSLCPVAVDAYNGMKREQAFGIPLKTTQAKIQFAGQIVGSSSLIFGGCVVDSSFT